MKTVDQYIVEAPEERRDALNRIREICLAHLPDYIENMTYNMPCYVVDELVHVAFASQKSYIALYILKENILDQYRDQFAKSRMGKGCIRYPNPKKIDFELIEEMIKASFLSDAEVC